MPETLIHLESVDKIFVTDDVETHALSNIQLEVNRGDYVSPDTNNGTLFLDYSDTVERLSCGPDCSIGGPPPPPPSGVPEPGTLALFGTALLALAFLLHRKQVNA